MTTRLELETDICPTGRRALPFDDLKAMPLLPWFAGMRQLDIGRPALVAHYNDAMDDIVMMGLLHQAEIALGERRAA